MIYADSFLGLLPDGNRVASQTDAHIYLAPTSWHMNTCLGYAVRLVSHSFVKHLLYLGGSHGVVPSAETAVKTLATV
jgi:hypothetical protein